MKRSMKIWLMVVAFALAAIAYNDHDGFYFTILMALYCAIITTLVTVEYWDDRVLRLISGTITLCTYNNLWDELISDPYTFGWNEKIFATLITINIIYNIIEWIKTQQTQSD